MTFFGWILLIGGVVSAIYGYNLNSSLGAQLNSILSSGTANPGNLFLYGGIVCAVVGIIILFVKMTSTDKYE